MANAKIVQNMTLPTNLLATKLSVPSARAQLVARPRLFERVEAGLRGKLTLIAAPAGFGKTTLLGAWHATPAGQGLPFAWVSLDKGDNDPDLFWSYVLAALDGVTPGVGQAALTMLRSPQPSPIAHVLTSLLNGFAVGLPDDRLPHVALVLEDYHVITTPVIHAALAWLVDCLPPSLHLVLVSREDPALPLARLRASGDLTELHADDLRFPPAEAAAFLNEVMGLALTASDVAALEARTEGWIAGLQLAALALQGQRDRAGFIHTFSGNNRYIVDYLATEVVERQPAQIQTFLLYTSILERMCGPLCDAVLGGLGAGRAAGAEPLPVAPAETAPAAHLSSQDVLEALERANLFVVPLDDERRWYRYHHLFADVLRQRLTRIGAGTPLAILHERASIWYEQNGLVSEAIQQALCMPDASRAAQLIERFGLGIIVGGQTQTALNWLNQMPQALRRVRPYLGILHSLALLFTSDLEGAEARLQETERSISAELPPAEALAMRGNVAAIRANMATYTGDLAACADFGEQVLASLPESEVIARTMARLHVARRFRVSGDVTPATERQALAAVGPIRASGNLLGTLGALINVARLQQLQGRLHTAAATYGQLIPVAGGPEELRGLHGGLPYFVGLGELNYEWNEMDTAAELLAQAMTWQSGTGTTDGEFLMLGYLAQARLQQAQGEPATAQHTLATGLELARRRGFAPHLVRRGEAVAAQLALAAGRLPEAVAWAEANSLAVDGDLQFTRETEYLVLARIRIAQAGQNSQTDFPGPVLELLDRLMTGATLQGRGASVLEILIVRALALEAQGQTTQALAVLTQAVGQAAPEGYAAL